MEKKAEIIKKFSELQEIDNLVGSLYTKTPTLRTTKFGYAYSIFHKNNLKRSLKDFSENINLARVESALEDPTTKEVLTDKESPRGFKYSKQGLKTLLSKEIELTEELENKEIKVQVYTSSHIPDALEPHEKELLKSVKLI